MLGYSLKDYWTDGKKLADAIVGCYEIFKPDSVDVSWDIVMEAETDGAELEFPENFVPWVKGYILTQKSALGLPKIPQPGRS